jgi:glycosyltransferase involved in cell wall biosynthesis
MTAPEPAAPRPWLHVDERWRGSHGIGRYATEVVARLGVNWEPLALGGFPSPVRDILRPMPKLTEGSVIYSPGYIAFPLSPQPQIVTICDLIHLKVDWPRRAKYLAYYYGPARHVIRRTGVVITISETSKAEISEWINDDSVRIVNAGVGCSDEFRLAGPAAPSDEPYVLYVGNMRPHKNLNVVFRALVLTPGIRLRAVLPKAEIAEAERQIAASGAMGRVEILHGVDDLELARLYRGSFATVMPSLLEGFGLPPLESIRCGTPVIYWSGCPAVAETVGDRGYAVTSAKDADEWANALNLALSEQRLVLPPTDPTYAWDDVAGAVDTTLADFSPPRIAY